MSTSDAAAGAMTTGAGRSTAAPPRTGSALRRAVRHRRGQLDVLPPARSGRRGGLGRPDAGRFRFAVKVSRYVTHIRRLADAGSNLDMLFERIQPLVDRIGSGRSCGSSRRRSGATTRGWRRALRDATRIPTRHRVPASIVVRGGRRWRHSAAHDVALVIGDHPHRPFQTTERTADWTYVRFHHGHRGRRGNYSDRELEGWARRIRTWSRTGDVYAYFNNDWEAFAVRNAERLERMLSEGRAGAAGGRAAQSAPRSGARRLRAS